MVQVSNSIQTEYPQTVAPKTDATKTDYMNSIMDQTQGSETGVGTTYNTNQTSKLDELLNELCKKFKNLNFIFTFISHNPCFFNRTTFKC